MSEGPPLESLTPLKIRPSQEDSNLTQFVQSNFFLQNLLIKDDLEALMSPNSWCLMEG